ncbi:MAG TPA: 2-dehydropantoate 2-reductase N-terminal domain-containing protein, partial [Caulobacter sp.]|nr:2-dehydropantoate 2-reductase N-terminal domain-containing protein [Caulobacter sp.]
MTRIAVIGPGAVGGVVAAWLAQDPGLAVEVCART